MKVDRAIGMLGICARAGKLITGEKACVQAIRSGEVYLAVLDGAASDNAVKALTNACSSHSVELIRVGAEQLGHAIGRPGRMAAGITDQRMAARVLELSREG